MPTEYSLAFRTEISTGAGSSTQLDECKWVYWYPHDDKLIVYVRYRHEGQFLEENTLQITWKTYWGGTYIQRCVKHVKYIQWCVRTVKYIQRRVRTVKYIQWRVRTVKYIKRRVRTVKYIQRRVRTVKYIQWCVRTVKSSALAAATTLHRKAFRDMAGVKTAARVKFTQRTSDCEAPVAKNLQPQANKVLDQFY